jgi:hypothetical protein
MVPDDATHRRSGHGVMTRHVAHDDAHRRALQASVGMGPEGKHPQRHYNRDEQLAHVEISVSDQTAPVKLTDEFPGVSTAR